MYSLAIVRETTECHRPKPIEFQLPTACKTEIIFYTRFDKTVFDLLWNVNTSQSSKTKKETIKRSFLSRFYYNLDDFLEYYYKK